MVLGSQLKLTKKDKKQIQIWVNALRSGEYKQTRGELQDEKGYCCLGVACDVFIPKQEQILDSDGLLIGMTPEEQLRAPKWLKKINHDFFITTSSFEETYDFTYLNDDKGFSFEEISDIIEAVYLFGVLDDVK